MRRTLALVATALWILGVEALPAAHQEQHAKLEAHTHAGVMHVHPGERKAPRRTSSQTAFDTPVAPHGIGDLDHHGAAIRPTAPPPTEPSVDRVVQRVISVAVDSQIGTSASEPSARGPPIALAHVVASDRRVLRFPLF